MPKEKKISSKRAQKNFTKSRFALVTIFTDENIDFKKIYDVNSNNIFYMVAQQEKCPKTGKLHYHVYMEFMVRKNMRCVQRLIFKDKEKSKQIHVEAPVDHERCAKYCKKVKSRIAGPWEFGEFQGSHERSRTDIDAVIQAIKLGKDFEYFKNNFPHQALLYESKIKNWIAEEKLKNLPDFVSMDVMLVYGAAGTGKTSWCIGAARRMGLNLYHVQSPADKNSKQWWQGYNGQKAILIDDFNGQWNINYLQQMLDGYIKQVDIKNTWGVGCYNTVYITSNKPIEDWFPKSYKRSPDLLESLKRRINRVMRMSWVENVITKKKDVKTEVLKNEKPVKVDTSLHCEDWFGQWHDNDDPDEQELQNLIEEEPEWMGMVSKIEKEDLKRQVIDMPKEVIQISDLYDEPPTPMTGGVGQFEERVAEQEIEKKIEKI